MVVTETRGKSVDQLIKELAEAGLQHHIRPISNQDSGISCRLFELDSECVRRARALEHLDAAFKATPVSELGPQDARIYRRERERRMKQLNVMLEERASLLVYYGHELIDSPLRHPLLADHYAALSV